MLHIVSNSRISFETRLSFAIGQDPWRLGSYANLTREQDSDASQFTREALFNSRGICIRVQNSMYVDRQALDLRGEYVCEVLEVLF